MKSCKQLRCNTMPRREDLIRFRHMLEAVQKAVKYARRHSRDDFEDDEPLILSLTRLLEILGEAAGKVSKEGRAACPNIPWPQVVGMRNRLIHAYFEVDLDQIWETIHEDLPPLITELKRIVKS